MILVASSIAVTVVLLDAFGRRLATYDFELPQRSSMGGLSNLQIPTVNLVPAFRTEGESTELLLKHDTH